MLKLVILAFFLTNIYATTFKVASYNVENLFDLENNFTEYREYIPNTRSRWNKKSFNKKLSNLIRVIKELDADILALQEIENKALLKTLQKRLAQYKYISFAKYNNSSIGLGFLSKIKIINTKKIDVTFINKLFRPILESTFQVDNIKFKIFNNHWPSKRTSESYRIKYANKLKKYLDKIPKDYDYILIGDFNSNYNEKESFKFNKKLNDTSGITGINHILNTSYKNKYITYANIFRNQALVHYNLWFEKRTKNRFSNKFRNENQTPDNILLNPALFDNKKISYIKDSFNVFKPFYLYKNGTIKRWQIKKRIHKNNGYSDHLPIYAMFSSKKNFRNSLKNHKEEKIKHIDDLYKKEHLLKPVILKNLIVIYKTPSSVIVKEKNHRAIYIYKNTKQLKEGYSYDLKIKEIKNFNGLKEVNDFEILKDNGFQKDYTNLYKEASKINLFDEINQNEIIKNLKGKYKRFYLHYNNKKIRIYARNKKLLPKDNQNITIIKAHLGLYRGKMQIVIHKKEDYEEN